MTSRKWPAQTIAVRCDSLVPTVTGTTEPSAINDVLV